MLYVLFAILIFSLLFYYDLFLFTFSLYFLSFLFLNYIRNMDYPDFFKVFYYCLSLSHVESLLRRFFFVLILSCSFFLLVFSFISFLEFFQVSLLLGIITLSCSRFSFVDLACALFLH
eukprot:UN2318